MINPYRIVFCGVGKTTNKELEVNKTHNNEISVSIYDKNTNKTSYIVLSIDAAVKLSKTLKHEIFKAKAEVGHE